jgi:hypothetical protein
MYVWNFVTSQQQQKKQVCLFDTQKHGAPKFGQKQGDSLLLDEGNN